MPNAGLSNSKELKSIVPCGPMGSLSKLYQRVRFCKRFGATWLDSMQLLRWTLDYTISIRSKSKKIGLQNDQEVKTIKVDFNGHLFPLYFRRQDLPMLYEVWMEQSYDISEMTIHTGCILDLGAHVGFTTLYLWTQLGNSRLYLSVEGSSKNAAVLKSNLKNIPEALTFETVITADGRKINFYDEVSGHLHQVHESLGEVHNSSALNALIKPYLDRSIAICKMDVEGIEYELLTKNNEWLNSTNLLFLEVHDHQELDLIDNEMMIFGFNKIAQKGIVVYCKEIH